MDMDNLIIVFLHTVSLSFIGLVIFLIYYFKKKSKKFECPSCHGQIFRDSVDAKQCRLCGSPIENLAEIRQ